MRPAHTRVQTVLRAALVVFMLVAVFALSSACAGDTAPDEPDEPVAEPTVTPEPEEPEGTTEVTLYLVRGETLGVAVREVPETVAVARVALEELAGRANRSRRPRSDLLPRFLKERA
jgi:hypothetical protein